MAHQPDSPIAPRVDAEIDIRGIFTFCAGLLVSAVVIQALIWVLFQYFAGREAARVAPEYPLAAGQETRLPPEPRLQTDPREDLRELKAHEQTVLDTYGWVDKPKGVVRIPIDEAIKKTVERGLPARPAAEVPK